MKKIASTRRGIRLGVGAGAILALSVLLSACNKEPKDFLWEKVADGDGLGVIHTDKALYKPGAAVKFTVQVKDGTGGRLAVRYRHLDEIIGSATVEVPEAGGEVAWEWEPPADDYQGYFVDAYLIQGKQISDHASIAVDVSSDWGRFPRYGYLADFHKMTDTEQAAVIDRLARFHMGGIQFYDWQWNHHQPVKLENGEAADQWQDIAGRAIYRDTVQRYIELAHSSGMKAMNYNLLFGSTGTAAEDGVKPEWGMYTDPLRQNQDHHPLPDGWKDDIYLQDPGNKEWQDYLFAAEKTAFRLFPFDGWHVDQLGDRGNLYTYQGKKINLYNSYQGFLNEAKKVLVVDYVMNAVSQFGQPSIGKADVKFMYSELWESRSKYADLKTVIDQNRQVSGGKNSVLAAYMDYDKADRAGEFNTPGVLLTDAVIFASGGAHLELGENMLAKEYFPNRNLKISDGLESALTAYYDFAVAYENLLRDGAEDAETAVSVNMAEAAGENGAVELSDEPKKGKVWALTKTMPGKDIVHLVNLADADSDSWRDLQGTQPEPRLMERLTVRLPAGKAIAKVWTASPDVHGGSPVTLEMKKAADGTVSVELPSLKYWSMLIIEYGEKDGVK
ncbi:glycoside hydrolase family 66 protein [Gorillibacterium massiliense]|uniref:glycoside hydrolase family 66 protein n=1 Tax=Gorillibacterium massiliense TaxID=1280390 RepID=UPI0004AC9229|nr:glycoside hydrolase family 66 protein [Gorillibacterium massiliense]